MGRATLVASGGIRLEALDAWRWRIPRDGRMRVDGLVIASRRLIEAIASDKAVEQLVNVATLPGIVGHAIAMPDIHWGYGFPIGGVAAFRLDDGVVSPGGVGYDINCGVRLVRTALRAAEVPEATMRQLVDALYRAIPAGVGSARRDVRFGRRELARLATRGARGIVERGMGWREDIEHIEEHGCIEGADPDAVSKRAFERGAAQVGTLGSGNHFAEVQRVDVVFDERAARAFGLFEGQVVVTVHTGSRGFGYQIAEDYLEVTLDAARRHGIELPDAQLACAPIDSDEGRRYLAAMACGANFAFANRQLITHFVREAFERVFGESAEALGMHVVYDVAHNIAKFEEHEVGGKSMRLCVHRKGATRALPAGHPAVPEAYRDIGQPVLVPGDMGRYSFVLVGQPRALRETFGSSCHGAGRVLSRAKARKRARGRDLYAEMQARGVLLRATGRRTVAEEMPEAYKDVSEVVDAIAGAGIAKPVVRLRPLAVVKG